MQFKTKIMLWFVIAVLIMGILASILGNRMVADVLHEELKKKGLIITKHLTSHVAYFLVEDNLLGLQEELLSFLEDDSDVSYLYIIGFDGEVVAHTFEDGFPTDLTNINIISKGESNNIGYLVMGGKNIIDIGYRVIGKSKAEIHVGLSEETITEAVVKLREIIFFLVIVTLFVTVIIFILLTNLVTKPLRLLAHSVSVFGDTGKYEELPVTSQKSAVEELTSAFNKMVIERKQAEEEKEKLQAQLLQSRKMEAIGMLAGGVAHDFNNLLTAIQGNAELAMIKANKEDIFYKNLEKICLVTERAANLTNQLLLFSRKQLVELTLLNINGIIDNLLNMLARLIGEDIVVNTDLASDLWPIKADKGSIEQAIMNLTVNARDAMPEGGKFTIKTENVTLDEEYCKRISYARVGRFVCLSVEDTGVGIDKEDIQHIFDPFFSTKGVGKGTGLGLSVVYGVAKQHEGWINVYSEPGQGTLFKIYLPAVFEESEVEGEIIKEKVLLEEFQGNGERILLVEDEKEVCEFATASLRENGYIVFEASNTKEALDIFKKEKEEFHLVFSDVVLPDQSGLELVEKLLSHKPKLRVLLSSGYMDDKSQWPAIREKGFPFLQKPYKLADLLRTVKEVVKGKKEKFQISDCRLRNSK